MTKPFSYIVPTSSFGSIEEVWDATGKALAEAQRARTESRRAGDTPTRSAGSRQPAGAPRRRRLAVAARGGAGAADNGKRELMWRADGQGFNYLQLEPAPPAANNARPAGPRR